MVVWGNNNQSVSATEYPLVKYDFTIPNCGSSIFHFKFVIFIYLYFFYYYYGPGALHATGYCSSLRRVSVPGLSSSPITGYNIYQNFQENNPDQPYLISNSDTYFMVIIPAPSGNYVFAQWSSSVTTRGEIPVVRYSFALPDCGDGMYSSSIYLLFVKLTF